VERTVSRKKKERKEEEKKKLGVRKESRTREAKQIDI
jgi:hypothetical protein